MRRISWETGYAGRWEPPWLLVQYASAVPYAPRGSYAGSSSDFTDIDSSGRPSASAARRDPSARRSPSPRRREMSRRSRSSSPEEGNRPRASPHAARVAAAETGSMPASLQMPLASTMASRLRMPFKAPKWDAASYSGRGLPAGPVLPHPTGQSAQAFLFEGNAFRIAGPE